MSATTSLSSSSPTTSTASILPTNGMGGSLYQHPIKLPLYHTNGTGLTDITSYAAIDAMTSFTLSNIIPHTIALSLSILTLLHILLLVPPHKRRLPINIVLNLCLVLQITTSSTATYLYLYGGYASSYPLLTGDITSVHYSLGYRTALILFHSSSVLVILPLTGAFYIVSRGLLACMRLKYTRFAYYAVLGYLLFNTFMWLCFSMAFAGYIINNIALAAVQDPLLTTRWTWKFLKDGEAASGGVCVAGWSCVIGTASVSVLRGRKDLFKIGSVGSARRNSRGAKGLFEVVLNLLAIVGVQSFILPVILCMLRFFAITNTGLVPAFDPEALIVPVTLSLLPIGSLFVNAVANPVMAEWAEASRSLTGENDGDDSKDFETRLLRPIVNTESAFER